MSLVSLYVTPNVTLNVTHVTPNVVLVQFLLQSHVDLMMTSVIDFVDGSTPSWISFLVNIYVVLSRTWKIMHCVLHHTIPRVTPNPTTIVSSRVYSGILHDEKLHGHRDQRGNHVVVNAN